jgi:hypothetical protein
VSLRPVFCAFAPALVPTAPCGLHLRHTAVDEQLDTVDEAGLVRCQEGHRVGHFLRFAQPPQRYLRCEVVEQPLPGVAGHQVAQAGSVTRAADSLDMPNATLSKLVRELEAHLGVRLLQRTTRRVSITAEGQAYYERAGRILRDREPGGRERFASTALAWLTTAWWAMRSIRLGQVQRHRAWMIRSYAVTLAPVLFRLMLPVAIASGVSPSGALISGLLWSSWLIPLGCVQLFGTRLGARIS